MAKNFIQSGEVLTLVAPGTVDAGELVQVGDICGVAVNDVLIGANVEVNIEGVWSLAKKAGVAITAGDKVYNDGGDTTNVETGKAFGVCVETVAGGASVVKVLLGVPCEALDAIAATAPTMAAVGGAGELIHTVAADRAQSKSGVVTANVVTEAAAAGAADCVVVSAGATKVVKDSAVLLANIPTMAANGGAGNLVLTAGANKALSDASVVAANVVTQAANATGAGTLPVYAGATKVLSDSLIPAADLKVRVAKERITNFADANAHDMATTLPADCIVLDSWINLITAGAGAVTCDFGVNGNADGFINGAPMDAALGIQTFGAVLDGTANWPVSTLRGDLLAKLAAGSAADDRGLYLELKDATSGGKKLAYQGSVADATVVVDLYVMYVEL